MQPSGKTLSKHPKAKEISIGLDLTDESGRGVFFGDSLAPSEASSMSLLSTKLCLKKVAE